MNKICFKGFKGFRGSKGFRSSTAAKLGKKILITQIIQKTFCNFKLFVILHRNYNLKTRKMKRSLSAMLLFLAAITPTFAQKNIAQSGNQYTIQSDNCVMLVDADNGGKVVSLKCDGKELIAQHAKVQDQDQSQSQGQGQRPARMRWENPNDFGSTFWPAPQSEWNWPPIATYDSKPYSAATSKASVTLISGKDAKYPYVFTKIYTPLGKGSFQIEYIIENAGDKEVKVAPWEITRVPSGGFIFCDAPEIYPTTEMTYTTEMGWQWIQFIAKRQNRKTFADCKGWLAFANDGLLFVKQYPDITSQEAAPGEEDFEIYFNQGQTYTEIENQGRLSHRR